MENFRNPRSKEKFESPHLKKMTRRKGVKVSPQGMPIYVKNLPVLGGCFNSGNLEEGVGHLPRRLSSLSRFLLVAWETNWGYLK